MIVDPQEVAKKGPRRSQARASSLRKEFGKILEADSPKV